MRAAAGEGRFPWWKDIAVMAAVWVVMSAAVNIVGNFPLNDDWIYGGATRSLLQDGIFRIPGPTIANVVAQAYWGLLFCLPFGFSYTALRISTLVLGIAGIWAVYALVTEHGGSRRGALIGSLALAVYPIYFGLAATFMTDVPFIAVVLISLLFLMRFVRTGSASALLVGTVASVAAVLIRQIALACPLGFAVICVLRYPTRWRMLLLGSLPLVASAATHVVYQHWLITSGRGPEVYFSGAAGLIPRNLPLFLFNSARFTLFSLPYFGLAMLPVLLVTGVSRPESLPARFWRPLCAMAGLAGILLFIGMIWKQHGLPFLGNILLDTGMGPLTQRDTSFLQLNFPPIPTFMRLFWAAATGLGIAGGIAFVLRVVAEVWSFASRWQRGGLTSANWLAVTIILAAGAYWSMIMLLLQEYGYFFDRYILPMVAFGAVLAALNGTAAGPRNMPARAFAAWTLVVVTALTSVGLTHDYLAWNRARWTALTDLTERQGVSPRHIDGGYEFNGSQLFTPYLPKTPDKSYWWVYDDEYMFASGPMPGYKEIARQKVHRWLPIGVPAVLTLKRL